MKKFSHKKTTSESIAIKGVISPEGDTITYIENDAENILNITEVVSKFGGMEVDFKIGVKIDEDVDSDD